MKTDDGAGARKPSDTERATKRIQHFYDADEVAERGEVGSVPKKCNHCWTPIVEGEKHICADHCKGCAELRDSVEERHGVCSVGQGERLDMGAAFSDLVGEDVGVAQPEAGADERDAAEAELVKLRTRLRQIMHDGLNHVNNEWHCGKLAQEALGETVPEEKQ
jgi:hypothetical protein